MVWGGPWGPLGGMHGVMAVTGGHRRHVWAVKGWMGWVLGGLAADEGCAGVCRCLCVGEVGVIVCSPVVWSGWVVLRGECGWEGCRGGGWVRSRVGEVGKWQSPGESPPVCGNGGCGFEHKLGGVSPSLWKGWVGWSGVSDGDGA